MQAGGAYCALLSGGFTCFTEPIRAACGFDEHRANRLELTDGRVTGQVLSPVLGRRAKLQALEELAAARRSEEHTSELQSLMRISYAVFCLKKKKTHNDEQLDYITT